MAVLRYQELLTRKGPAGRIDAEVVRYRTTANGSRSWGASGRSKKGDTGDESKAKASVRRVLRHQLSND